MKPPPVQYIEKVQRKGNGCGCSLGCMGIGCLLAAVGFFGLLILAYYAVLHTSLPLQLVERALEDDGKVEIEGLTGNIANGLRFEKFRFLGDGKKWSELRDVSLRYRGLAGINLSGDIDIHEVHIGEGTLYLDIVRPEQFSLSLPGFEFDSVLDQEERAALMRAGNWNIDSVDIGAIQVINPQTKFRFDIDHVRISGMRFRRSQLVDLGDWSIVSDPLEVRTEGSRRWPESVTARRLVAVLRQGFFANLKQDLEMTVEIEAGEGALQYHGECADGKLVVDDNGRRMIVEFNGYTVADFLEEPRELPLKHVTFRATRAAGDERKANVRLESGGHFQVGETIFQMTEPTIDPSLRVLRGESQWDGVTIRIELAADSLMFGRLEPKLWVDEQPATTDQWAEIVFGRPPDELTSLEQSVLKTALQRSAAPEADAENEVEAPAVEEPESDGLELDAEAPMVEEDSDGQIEEIEKDDDQ